MTKEWNNRNKKCSAGQKAFLHFYKKRESFRKDINEIKLNLLCDDSNIACRIIKISQIVEVNSCITKFSSKYRKHLALHSSIFDALLRSRLSRPSESGKLVNIRQTKSVGKKYTTCIASQQNLITSIGGQALKIKTCHLFLTVSTCVHYNHKGDS